MSFALANIFISRTHASAGDKGVMFSVVVTMGLSLGLWLTFAPQGATMTGSRDWWQGVFWFVIAGLGAMVFGRSLLYESIRRLGVVRSTAVKRLNPFFSVILAAIILNEALDGLDWIGMLAIALAFGLLVNDSIRHKSPVDAAVAPGLSAYGYGVFAALAYALAYNTRALGLQTLPSPAFGTFISALSGFLVFGLLTTVSERYLKNFRNIFKNLDRWIVLAAIAVSAGQILLFAALAYEKVSTVVMIASLEIFISIFLSVAVFRHERMPSPPVLISAFLAMIGVVLVAWK